VIEKIGFVDQRKLEIESFLSSPFMYPQQTNAARLPAHFYLATLPPTLHQYFPISNLVFLLLYLHNFDIPQYFCFQLQQLHLVTVKLAYIYMGSL
jgi:hypothetical protein